MENGVSLESLKPQDREDRRETVQDVDSAGGNNLSEDDNGGSCGWVCIRPGFLQKLRSVKVFLLVVSLASIIQGVIVNGFINVFVSTLERRYGISSTESGMIIGAYDLANLVFILPVSFLGGRPGASKPRWVAIGVLLIALGSLVFALPQFTEEPYQVSSTDSLQTETCQQLSQSRNGSGLLHRSNGENYTSLNSYKYVFMLAQVLLGAGATALFTLGVTFIDDNVSNKMQPLYTGFFYMTGTVGPAIGFVGGGQLLRIYTDFLTVPADKIAIGPESSLWVGAWWLGFLIAGAGGILVAVLLLAFPAQLPGYKSISAAKLSESKNSAEDEVSANHLTFAESVKQFPAAVKDLASNLPFICVCLGAATTAFSVAGFGGFLPKIIESQFSVPPSTAALIMGACLVPSGVLGTLLGGYIIKKLNLSPLGILRLTVIVTAAHFISTLCYIIYCPELSFTGVNVPYEDGNKADVTLKSACNINCDCSLDSYNPICGVDNRIYYSPCFAGCSESRGSGSRKVYGNCSCIEGDPLTTLIQGTNTSYAAAKRNCTSDCPNLPFFIAGLFCFLLTLFLITMPSVSAILRCVESQHRSFALGVQTLTSRMVGGVPGPIVFGYFIDGTCELWQLNSDETGSCIFYDNYRFSRAMVTIGLVCTGSTVFFMSVAYLAYWRKTNKNDRTGTTDKDAAAYDNPGVDSN